jgi:hypothetical protein
MKSLKQSIFNFVEEAFNALDRKVILSEMTSDAKAKFGEITPTSSQSKFELTFDEAMPDIVQFWFNTSDGSTHLEFYEV